MTTSRWLCLISLCGAACPVSAAEPPSARDILNKVNAAYSHLSAVHISAKQDQTLTNNAQSGFATSDCEITASGAHQYFVRLKRSGHEAIMASDGETTWRALADQKKWSQMAAASLDSSDNSPIAMHDLYGYVARTVMGQCMALAAQAEEPRVVKEEDVKVGGQKIPCYVIHCRVGKLDFEVWVDKARFVVLEYRERGETSAGRLENRVRMTALDLNPQLQDTAFHFQPGKGWAEAESLLLPGEEGLLLTGMRAANFSLKTLEGEAVTLQQTRGKVVVLDFWATWCPPCRAELPSIEKLRAEFSGAVDFYGINDEESGTVKSFLNKNHYQMAVLMDSKRQVHRQYGVTSIPTLLIIDKNGVIKEHFIGSRSEASLRKAIQTVVSAN